MAFHRVEIKGKNSESMKLFNIVTFHQKLERSEMANVLDNNLPAGMRASSVHECSHPLHSDYFAFLH